LLGGGLRRGARIPGAMANPTVASRLSRRCIVMSGDKDMVSRLRQHLPPGWDLTQTGDLDALGGFQVILQYRFLLLDLDAGSGFDALDIIRKARVEMMLNVPIFCFGGTPAVRDQARLARADRFFERDEIVARLRGFCEQFGWGG
jgi:hypothetical protein